MDHKQLLRQFIIALILFLLGYFTFNSKLFASTLQETAVLGAIVK